MGGGNPDFDLGPPLVKFLQGAVVQLRGCDNFLSRNGTCCGGGICLVGKELGKCLPEILLVLYELLDCTFPIHFEERLVGGSTGAGVSETREPKSVTTGIRWRGWWYVVGFSGDKWELEIQVVKDSVMDGGEVLEFELGVSGTKPFEEGDFVVMQERSLKDVGDPLTLLCVRRWVVDVTRNGRLTYVCDVCVTIWVLAPPRCSA